MVLDSGISSLMCRRVIYCYKEMQGTADTGLQKKAQNVGGTGWSDSVSGKHGQVIFRVRTLLQTQGFVFYFTAQRNWQLNLHFLFLLAAIRALC